MRYFWIKILTPLIVLIYAPISWASIHIVAAENMYGNLAKTIGGQAVSVNNIINNPNADPHLFTTSPKTAKQISQAQVVIYNGAGYDPWMQSLLQTQSNNNKISVINVADLVGVKDGANPHVWYQPKTMPQLAKKLTTVLSALAPQSKEDFESNLDQFLKKYQQQVLNKIQKIAKKYQGRPVTATEPVFGYMIQAMKLDDKGMDFQWVIMNDAEPSAKMMARYLSLLSQNQVDVLFYNGQVTDTLTQHTRTLAQNNHIPVVPITETQPDNKTIIQWFSDQLTMTQKALEKGGS